MATPLPGGWEREGPQAGAGSGMSALGGGAEDTAKGVFDASQYAFFSLSGPGGAAGLGEEELGGLDDDDDDDAGLGLEEEGIGESEELGGLEDEDEDELGAIEGLTSVSEKLGALKAAVPPLLPDEGAAPDEWLDRTLRSAASGAQPPMDLPLPSPALIHQLRPQQQQQSQQQQQQQQQQPPPPLPQGLPTRPLGFPTLPDGDVGDGRGAPMMPSPPPTALAAPLPQGPHPALGMGPQQAGGPGMLPVMQGLPSGAPPHMLLPSPPPGMPMLPMGMTPPPDWQGPGAPMRGPVPMPMPLPMSLPMPMPMPMAAPMGPGPGAPLDPRWRPMPMGPPWAQQPGLQGPPQQQVDLSSQFGRGPGPGQGRGPGPLGGSKLMTADEVQMIVRMHWTSATAAASASQSKDPYTQDYYHQASQCKAAARAGLRYNFAPPLHASPQPGMREQAHQPQAFLPMVGLGRVPVPSIRRPRPLLDVDGLFDANPPDAQLQSQFHGDQLQDDSMLSTLAAALSRGHTTATTGQQARARQAAQGAPDSLQGQVRGSNRGRKAAGTGAATKPLEQEPLLAARIAIEDGMGLLLAVDDVDRMCLALSLPGPRPPGYPPSDGQAHSALPMLQQRRQALLDALTASMHLGDPLQPGCPVARLHGLGWESGAGSWQEGYSGPWAAEDWSVGLREDVVFLRLATLPKGRKLLLRFLRLLPPGSHAQRLVVLAIFRHLRRVLSFLDAPAAAASPSVPRGPGLRELLAQAALQAGASIEAGAACLWAFALQPEAPVLRPLGQAGDACTLLLCTLLDAAGPAVSHCQEATRQQVWRAAFDAFFARLSALLCFDAILSAFPLSAEAAAAVSKEMPLDLLRSALPHTNQQQKDRVGALLHGLLRS